MMRALILVNIVHIRGIASMFQNIFIASSLIVFFFIIFRSVNIHGITFSLAELLK